MVMECREGRTLQEVGFDGLSSAQRVHLFDQVADVLLQLRRQEFSRMGSLSLERLDVAGRPFSVEANGQEMEGLQASYIWGPATTYSSAQAYCDSVIHLAVNGFVRARYAVYDRGDAEEMLYYLNGFRDFVSNWLDPGLDAGPFVLAHGDFRPANLLVDPESLDLVAVLDWEWSGVVPLQMFAPPTWLTWRELGGLCNNRRYDAYVGQLEVFVDHVARRESATAPADASSSLSAKWRLAGRHGSVLIAAALNNPTDISTVYAFVDGRFCKHAESLATRITAFLRDDTSRQALVAKKVREMRLYKIELWFHNLASSRSVGYIMFYLAVLLALVTAVSSNSLRLTLWYR